MNNIEKYDTAFLESFNVEPSSLPGLVYQSIDTWDSIGHLQLIAILEDEFDIVMDTDDVIDFSSYEKGKEILQKYGINI